MGLRTGFGGEQFQPPAGGGLTAASTVSSTQIGSLSSRQVVFGSPTGGIAQSTAVQVDSTQGFLAVGTSVMSFPLSAFQAGGPQIAVLSGSTLDWRARYGFADADGLVWQIGMGKAASTVRNFFLFDQKASAFRLFVNSSGHIGIGTTTPAFMLDVNAVADAVFRLGSTGAARPFVAGSNSTGTDIGYYPTHLLFTDAGIGYTVAASSGQITSAGNVGFGTTAPGARLHAQTTVNGNVFLITGTTSGTQPAINVQSTGSTMKLGFWTTAGSTQPSAYATTGTTGRTLPTTIDPISIYSSAVGAQVNQIQGVLKTLIQDLAGYGLLPSTV